MVTDRNNVHWIRTIKGGGPNRALKCAAIFSLAFLSLFKDLVEVFSLGFLTSDLYENYLWNSDMFDRWWWQEGRGNGGKEG